MKILNRWTNAVLWEGEAESVVKAVYAAVNAEADLRLADLRGANLRRADLGMANLRGANLRRADLGMANLRDADLRGANLRDADLLGADLLGADLRRADLLGADLGGAKDVRLPTGELLTEYFEKVVPALLTAAGQSLDSFKEHWECHDWDNCPMAHAFRGSDISDVPILIRPRAEQFINLFDAKQIPWSVIQAAIDKTATR